MNVAVLRAPAPAGLRLGTTGARSLVILAFTAAAIAGAATTLLPASAHAVADAGADLTRLLRAMAGLKALMAGAAFWACSGGSGRQRRYPGSSATAWQPRPWRAARA